MFELSIWREVPFRSRSRAFVLRLWREELGTGCREWRGQLRDVSTDEVRYFRDWTTLAAYLQDMLERER